MPETLKPNTEQGLSADKTTIARNLELLNKDMLELLMTESIGGNAGEVKIDDKKYSCGAANGYVDPETGKIIAFGNVQDIEDKKVVEKNIHFTLRVAVDFQSYGFFKIVDVLTEGSLPDKAKSTLEMSIREWNTEHGQLHKIRKADPEK